MNRLTHFLCRRRITASNKRFRFFPRLRDDAGGGGALVRRVLRHDLHAQPCVVVGHGWVFDEVSQNAAFGDERAGDSRYVFAT